MTSKPNNRKVLCGASFAPLITRRFRRAIEKRFYAPCKKRTARLVAFVGGWENSGLQAKSGLRRWSLSVRQSLFPGVPRLTSASSRPLEAQFTAWGSVEPEVGRAAADARSLAAFLQTKKGKIMQAVISTQTRQYDNNDEYELFLSQIQDNFSNVITEYGNKLFTTDVVGLFDAFLEAFPVDVRQHYACSACRRFVDKFGGLVSITPDGKTIPVMWPSKVSELYQGSVEAAKYIVTNAKVTGIFLSSQSIWGRPVTGEWHHMAITVNGLAFKPTIQTAFQVMSEKKEDYKTLISGLIEFPLSAIEQAITLLKTDSLYRSEKCLGIAEWLKELHEKRNATKNQAVRNNLTWLAVATAPVGYCHIRSTMIGTLLEDIVAGLPFEAISHRFAEKMHPLQYQRPQALPTAGNIAQAEKIIAQLQAAGSLARRFARLDEIKTVWQPELQKETPLKGGIFSHLRTKSEKPTVANVKIPTQIMTWVKFLQTVLPTAKNIEFYVPSGTSNFAALITAVNQDAPPIIQWDLEDNRNPVSWYVYHGGSSPSQWNLSSGYCKVTGICYQPSMWYSPERFSHQGESIFILLQDCCDMRMPGVCLFPEILKSEFRSIRSTIEEYSRRGTIDGKENSNANGVKLEKGRQWDIILRVDGLEYKLDRWD